jgi:hypothetical protein
VSPSPVPTRTSSPYKGPVRAGAKGEVRSAGVEPAASSISGWSLCQLGYEHVEPPPGADPGHPPYESGAAAVRGGVAGEPGFEPGLACPSPGPEPGVLPVTPFPIVVRTGAGSRTPMFCLEGRRLSRWARPLPQLLIPELPGRDGARPGLAVLHAVEMSNAVHVHPQAVRRRDARTRTRTLPLWRRTLSQLSCIPWPSYRKAQS